METIFFNIAGLIVGVMLFIFGITAFTRKNIFEGIITIIIAPIFIITGVIGFIIPDDYWFITISIFAVITVLSIIFFIVMSKREKKNKKN